MTKKTNFAVCKEVNKLGVQIAKKILDNIKDDTIYTISNLEFTGADIKEHYFELLSDNIIDSVFRICSLPAIIELCVSIHHPALKNPVVWAFFLHL